MRRRRSSQCQPDSRRKGVSARVRHRKYRVQSPLFRVMNSTGLAPRRSVPANTSSRAKGSSAQTNTVQRIILNWVGLGLNIRCLVELTQVHALVKRSHFGIAIEHQGLALARKQPILADATLA